MIWAIVLSFYNSYCFMGLTPFFFSIIDAGVGSYLETGWLFGMNSKEANKRKTQTDRNYKAFHQVRKPVTKKSNAENKTCEIEATKTGK